VRRRAAAEAICSAIACAEGAVACPYNPRDSESLTTLLALRESLADVWPYETANLLTVLDTMDGRRP
jgi:hypothetical protein